MTAYTPEPAPAPVKGKRNRKRGADRNPTAYSRTDNGDGTFNSRCLHCLMTVASDVRSQAKLDRVERGHICVEKALFELLRMQMNQVSHQEAS